MCFHSTDSCINITYSQCQMLPYNHTTLIPVLSIVKSIEMEKFLKFFGYLHRLSCYQHIMLFGCSLALPECISDGDDRYLGTEGWFLEPIVAEYCVSNHNTVLELSLMTFSLKILYYPKLSLNRFLPS